jgi:hypothetical protein
MPRPGDAFQLHDGETVAVRALTPELLELDAEWAATEHKPPAHLHPSQSERFELREGELHVLLEGQQHVLRPGDSLEIPAGAAHAMWSSGPGITRASWQVRPALRSAEFFAYVHALRAAGHTRKGGVIDLFAAGALLTSFRDEFRLTLPSVVQRPAMGLLAMVARLRGYPRPASDARPSAAAPPAAL